MALDKGDIVLVQFPFTDLSQTKLRPAVILLENTSLNEVTLCFISSQNVDNLSSDEFALVQQGKSKKSKVKRKNSYATSFLPISNGLFISAVLY